MINYTSQLLSKPQDEVNRKILEMPALILDQKDKMFSMFNSSNELVEDPLAVEREGAMINRWTLEERNIFSEKLAAFEKDFQKIASFLPKCCWPEQTIHSSTNPTTTTTTTPETANS